MNDNQKKVQLLNMISSVTDDYTNVYDYIDVLAQEGRINVLYQVARALKEDYQNLLQSIQQQWTREEHAKSLQELTNMGVTQEQLAKGAIIAIFDHIEEVLSFTPGFPAIESVLRLLEMHVETSTQLPLLNSADLLHVRLFASRLANVQEFSTLLDIFKKYSDQKQQIGLLSCLLQEMVVRGEHLESVAVLQHFHHLLQIQKHPLAWLPLMPTSIEVDFFLSMFFTNNEEYSVPLTHSFNNRVPLISVTETKGIFIEKRSDIRRERMKTAVLNWEEESNGRSEAKVFVSTPFAAGTITEQVLLSLPLTCLKGTSAAKVIVREIAPAQAFLKLFVAAANGGAYNKGHMGAWGRLEAWQSVSGLVEANEQDSWKQVLERVLHYKWYSFEAKSAWYYSIAWDLGLVAVSPDRKSVAILAATDTD